MVNMEVDIVDFYESNETSGDHLRIMMMMMQEEKTTKSHLAALIWVISINFVEKWMKCITAMNVASI